jgi:hypothetical protein
MAHLWRGFLFVLLALAASCQSPGRDDNTVVQYFTGAELQVEMDAQKEEIRHVFRDLLSLPAAKVKERRYADYQGNAGTWTAPQLLEKYYVPAKPMGLSNNDRFYRDMGTPRARAVLEALLKDLQ